MADGEFIGGAHLESVQRAVASNLTKSLVALSHPGALQVANTIYSHEESSTLDMAIGQYRQGIIKVPSSSLSFGSNINFTLLNRSILGTPYLTGAITIPQGAVLPSMWIYPAIQNFQLSIPGISNLQYNGLSMLSMLLRSNTTERRNELNNLCPGGVGVTGGTTIQFAMPLVVPWCSSNVAHSGYYLDADTLASVVQMSFLFNPVSQWIGGQTGGISGSMPTQFNFLNLKLTNQLDLLNTEFSLAKNSDIFRFPFNYMVSYPLFSQPNGAATGTIQQIQLQALPSAELTSIIIWAVPSLSKGVSTNNQAVDWSPIQFAYEKLSLQGQDLILLETNPEILTENNWMSVDSSAGFYFNTYNAAFANGGTGPLQYSNATYAVNALPQRFTALECFISDPSSCYESSSKFQLAQNYSGQIFTFYYILPSNLGPVNCPYIDFYITYVANAVLDVQRGTANMIV